MTPIIRKFQEICPGKFVLALGTGCVLSLAERSVMWGGVAPGLECDERS